MSTVKKKTVVIAGAILLVLALACTGYFVWQGIFNKGSGTANTPEPTYTEKTTSLNASSITNNDEYADTVETYADDYTKVKAEVFSKVPKDWTAETVDKAYFLLAYDVRLDEYQYVGVLLDKIEEAKVAGVNIDRPGADQAYRDNLRKIFEDAMSNPDFRPSSAKRGY